MTEFERAEIQRALRGLAEEIGPVLDQLLFAAYLRGRRDVAVGLLRRAGFVDLLDDIEHPLLQRDLQTGAISIVVPGTDPQNPSGGAFGG